jgi:succinate dehydrogenase/fumarate reductase flavoprotein subunit
LNMGTSRNTGSDKQTYYKLTLEGGVSDSVLEMAKTLFNGGGMHGDIALVEAALSARTFYKLVDIGVPFPHNRYGEYVGYKTDHDPRKRATSAGPLTSRFMTEKLEKRVINKGIKIFDGYLVIGILTDSEKTKVSENNAIGLISLKLDDLGKSNMGFTLFNCTNIIYATGGPAGIYMTSVYPASQTGASGIAFEAGAEGVNLTESQYGIASIKFRWNLSGTYQQVLPRYVSTREDGSDEREFLNDYFDRPGRMLDAVFLKGYQWPFDPRKIDNFGSSLIDILVYNETQVKGRRVFLDYMKNPEWCSSNDKLDFSLLGTESHEYLKNSNALFGTPIQRLSRMNQPAIDLYKNNGIDLSREYLEIAVCAQHNNGGLKGGIWWESNVRHLFPVGEVCGTLGVYRPGGTALNSSQVGSTRAAQYISANYSEKPMDSNEFSRLVLNRVSEKLNLARKLVDNSNGTTNVKEIKERARKAMTGAGAHIRSLETVDEAIKECRRYLTEFAETIKISRASELPEAFRNRDMLITQFVYLNAIREFIEKGGKSRGSYLIQDNEGKLPLKNLPDAFKFSLDSGELLKRVCEVRFSMEDGIPECDFEWKGVRPIPKEENWFEKVWNEFRQGDIIR